MTRVHVTPPPAADGYDVLVEPGLLERAAALLSEHSPADRYAVIADTNVAPLHGEPLVAQLLAAGLRAQLFVHPAGEVHKTTETWLALTHALLAAGCGRDTGVLALGGGVTGDVGGFVAAACLRGLPLVQLPTSLLAMVDAAIGGKTGVDTVHGKNLLGAFHPPRLVLIDPLVLRTLPLPEFRNGMAEVIKHGAIADADYLEEVAASARELLDLDPATLQSVIARSARIKAAVVSRDPLERGERAALNFGHTFGHALERHSGYGIPHGHAVAVGMMLACTLGEEFGITESGTSRRLASVLATFGLPVAVPAGIPVQALLAAADTDKKVRQRRKRFVLLRRLGEVARTPAGEWTVEIPDDRVQAALERAASPAVD